MLRVAYVEGLKYFVYGYAVSDMIKDHSDRMERKGNVLFNDALNTFYLRLYGVRHG